MNPHMDTERKREVLAYCKRRQIQWQRIMDDTSKARWWRVHAAKRLCHYTKSVNALVADLTSATPA